MRTGHAAVWGTLMFVLACHPFPTRAGLVLSDDFDYPNGALVTVSAGFWIHHSPASSATGEVNVVSGRVFLTQAESEDVNAALQGQPYSPASGAVLYASFTINFAGTPGGAGTYFAHFKDSSTSGFRDKIFVTTNGAPAGFYRIGVANFANVPNATLTTNLALNVNYTLVTRYSASNAVGSVWIDPAFETDPGAMAADAASTISVASFALRQSLSSSDGMGSLYVDNVRIGTSFADVTGVTNPPAGPPIITAQPQSQTVAEGGNATFTVTATGASPLSYQWRFGGTNLPGAIATTLALNSVSTNQAGDYSVTVTNTAGVTNSLIATLTVVPTGSNPPAAAAFSLVTYNCAGFGTSDWSTNAPQVRAIGRQMQYLQPDIVTLQEIPYTNRWQMTNFVAAFLPGYSLVVDSNTDGSLTSTIISRFPITRFQSWLPHADLNPFGYTSANFTRDLFEAQVAVPGIPQPLHIFTTHLKAGQGTNDSNRRTAEAGAISNFFVNAFLTSNSFHPYVLTGDLNEDISRPPSSNPQSIQKLLSTPTGLQLTTPRNPVTQSELTHSIQSGLVRRYDYILPNGLLAANVRTSQVFRTDLLVNPPAPLLTNDDVAASDHLPVYMVFSNPYDKPFPITSITRSTPSVTLRWQSVLGQPYRVEFSSNLTAWSTLANNVVATGTTHVFSTNVAGGTNFFRVYRVP